MSPADEKLLTCVLPKGAALPLLRELRSDKGVTRANISSARGVGRLTRPGSLGGWEQEEKDILNVLAPAEQAEALFFYIFDRANIGRPGGGMIYMSRVQRASSFVLPELPEEG